MDVLVQTGGKKYLTRFAEGRITEHTHQIEGEAKDSGTTVTFTPDKKIWKDETFDLKRIHQRIEQLAYLNPGLTMNLDIESKDAEGNEVKLKKSYNFPNGINAYIQKLCKGKDFVADPMYVKGSRQYEFEDDKGKKVMKDVNVKAAFAYTNSYTTNIMGFVNNIYQEYGGDHDNGFKAGILAAIRKYALESKLIKESKQIAAEDTREGLICVLCVSVADPNYEGQGKNNLRMPEVRNAVRQIVEDYLYDYLMKDNKRAKKIIDKCLRAAKVRESVKKARDAARGAKEIASSNGLPGKLADCSSRKPEECEIFFVEGK